MKRLIIIIDILKLLKMKLFAEIIDKGECISQLYKFSQIPWAEQNLKNLACKEEWAKTNFYPSNGLVAEVSYTIKKNMKLRIDVDIYLLRINEKYYVPMTEKGVKFISETEYNKRRSENLVRGMDERQRRINDL